MKRRYDNEIDNRSLGKWRVGFGVSTFRLEQHQHQLVEIFKPMNFPSIHSISYVYFIRKGIGEATSGTEGVKRRERHEEEEEEE